MAYSNTPAPAPRAQARAGGAAPRGAQAPSRGAVARVWITEKPSMAKCLVAGMKLAWGVDARQDDGCYVLSNGDVVAPLFGHMIEMEKPGAYLAPEQLAYSVDKFSYLPLIPEKFFFHPKPETDRDYKVKMHNGRPVVSERYTRVVGLIRQAREVVNAGDIDREGQLIVDELLEAAGISPEGRDKPIHRFPLVKTREEDIAADLRNPAFMERNGDAKWVLKREAARTRQEGDWLLGMNASMAYQQKTGYNRMSVGRVQTPTLAMVVRRDLLIESFKPKDYFVPVIVMTDGTEMRWDKRVGSEGQPGFDSEGRIIDRALAQAMVDKIAAGLDGRITAAQSKDFSEAPPLPFSLGTLQSAAARAHGLTLKQVSGAAQALYERHKAITYVGTDCQFLPKDMLKDASKTMAGIARAFTRQANGANMKLVSKAWDDTKVQEHFAIVPTGELPTGANDAERAVYETVVKRYIAQFYPAFQYRVHQLKAEFGADQFKASRREVLNQGWKEVDGGDDNVRGERNVKERPGETEVLAHPRSAPRIQ